MEIKLNQEIKRKKTLLLEYQREPSCECLTSQPHLRQKLIPTFHLQV